MLRIRPSARLRFLVIINNDFMQKHFKFYKNSSFYCKVLAILSLDLIQENFEKRGKGSEALGLFRLWIQEV